MAHAHDSGFQLPGLGVLVTAVGWKGKADAMRVFR
jgi:hypothetical protein